MIRNQSVAGSRPNLDLIARLTWQIGKDSLNIAINSLGDGTGFSGQCCVSYVSTRWRIPGDTYTIED